MHPWVLEYEKKYKEEKLKVCDKNNSSVLNADSNIIDSNTFFKTKDESQTQELIIYTNSINDTLENSKPNPQKRSISEKIQERLNMLNIKKEGDTVNIHNTTLQDQIDLNEIENKLNMTVNKTQKRIISDLVKQTSNKNKLLNINYF